MTIEIAATGDEILTGAVADTNSSFIAAALESEGFEVTRHTAVGDDLDHLIDLFREISRRAEAAVVTGGLGPTSDDLTVEAAARAAGVPVEADPQAEALLTAFFEARGWPLTEANRKQALLPRGAVCLGNSRGTAPGFRFTIGGCVFFFLPGVPHEMRGMVAERVIPQLREIRGADHQFTSVKTLSCYGLPESEAGVRVQAAESFFPDLKLGLRAHFPAVQVKFYGRGTNGEALSARLNEAARWAREQLGEAVYSERDETLAAAVGRQLLAQGKTLAAAESCTGGLIGHELTNVPGSSQFFLFSGVTYANEAKVRVLGVSPETLEAYGAVSEETVREMARGAREVSGADFAIATSGIAGPDGGSPEKPVGTVCLGLSSSEGETALTRHFPFGDRLRNKEAFAWAALDLLRRYSPEVL